MAFKFKIIAYMERIALLLPKDIGSLFFLESDKEILMEKQTEEEARTTAKKIYTSLHMGSNNDMELCPFCVNAEGKCQNCGYFKHHGSCYLKASDYFVMVTLLNGVNNKYGIFDYIKRNTTPETILLLKNTLYDESNFRRIDPNPPLIA